jgi:hypothetical protein
MRGRDGAPPPDPLFLFDFFEPMLRNTVFGTVWTMPGNQFPQTKRTRILFPRCGLVVCRATSSKDKAGGRANFFFFAFSLEAG